MHNYLYAVLHLAKKQQKCTETHSLPSVSLKNSNITHIVSVLDWEFKEDPPLTRGYQHLHIPVDDVEDENLLEWFPRSNRFIQQGLDYRSSDTTRRGNGVDNLDEKGSGVYIHW